MKKIISIVGARPQFIKAKPVFDALKKKRDIRHLLVHTGQHYDYKMSKIFFDELSVPRPYLNLGVGSYTHARQTAVMIEKIETVLRREKPQMVIVYGDTNSTLAGALTAAKMSISVSHVEAGLRSYNREMPEEINRVLTDHVSSILFCPTKISADNLSKEGITEGVYLVGDTMYDAMAQFLELAHKRSKILSAVAARPHEYLLATVHRQGNADDRSRLKKIFMALGLIREKIIMPLHPRTALAVGRFGIKVPANVTITEPVGYLDMLMLEKYARVIMTDSGGMQKEAYWMKVPCVTLRDETEWVETVTGGWNVLAGCDVDKIVRAARKAKPGKAEPSLFGNGRAAEKIAKHIGRSGGLR